MINNVIKGERPARVYRIERDEKTGTVIIHVGVKWPAGLSWRLLAHCKLHSPTGFEVGYGGSGPADTEASILADHFDEKARAVERAWRGRSNGRPAFSIQLHQVASGFQSGCDRRDSVGTRRSPHPRGIDYYGLARRETSRIPKWRG